MSAAPRPSEIKRQQEAAASKKTAPAPPPLPPTKAVPAAAAVESKAASSSSSSSSALSSSSSSSSSSAAVARPAARSSVVAAAPAGVNYLLDGMTFVEKNAYTSVQKLVDGLQQKDAVDQKQFRSLLGFVVTFLEQGTLPLDKKNALLSDATYLTLFNGLYDLVNCAIRSKVPDKVLVIDLKKLNIPDLYANDILTTLTTKRDSLEQSASSSSRAAVALPSISDLSWRVDVTVSTTSLSRVFRPSITLQVTLSDGAIKTFECSVEKFHQMRYNVAKLLKNMQDLEQHPTLVRDV